MDKNLASKSSYQAVKLKLRLSAMPKEYRCTRNASYSHQCLGHDDLSARQGYYLMAESSEEAWQKMACRFPEETLEGFTVQEWEGSDISVVEV